MQPHAGDSSNPVAPVAGMANPSRGRITPLTSTMPAKHTTTPTSPRGGSPIKLSRPLRGYGGRPRQLIVLSPGCAIRYRPRPMIHRSNHHADTHTRHGPRRALLAQRRAAVAHQLRRLAIELTDLDRRLDDIEQSEGRGTPSALHGHAVDLRAPVDTPDDTGVHRAASL
jgi:hypothetical protein